MSRAGTASLRVLRAASGVTLVEALVALLIMSLGMVALVGLQGNMRRSADLAKQRSEAVRIGQQDLERLRAFSSLAPVADLPAGARSYLQLVDSVQDDAGPASNAQFQLSRAVTPATDGSGSNVTVRVNWQDRAGEQSFVELNTFIARIDPRLAGSVGLPPDLSARRMPLSRHVAIPVAAKDLGDGRSAFKPPALSSGVAWVFNNQTGTITQRCMGFDPNTRNEAITLADVSAYCNSNVTAYLLSGHVRFSTTGVPDPVAPRSPALALDMAMNLTSAHPDPGYECFDNAPSTPNPAMTEGVAYYCAVYPNNAATPIWDGRLSISGLALGGADYRVCRYSADYNGNGRIDNAEHPLNYTAVAGALTHQNFLVIRAAQSCPAGQAADPAQGIFFNSATVEHQPNPS